MKKGLSEEAKNFAVTCFAHFMSPTQVAEAVNERFGTSIDKRNAQHYDPTKAMGQQLGKARKVLFDLQRKRFLEQLADIPIANRAARLKQLDRHYWALIEKKNLGMALKVLEQAAKEAGNFHSSEKTLNLKGRIAVDDDVTEDEMRNGIAAAIATALDEERQRLRPAEMTKH